MRPTVLAITKRPAELCATQALLYGAGFDLVTATNMAAARSVVKGMAIEAVMVCKHSWASDERDRIVSELARLDSAIDVMIRCPGCTGCDEAAGKPGKLDDERPLVQLMAAVRERGKSF